jgi:hypothetical protein
VAKPELNPLDSNINEPSAGGKAILKNQHFDGVS